MTKLDLSDFTPSTDAGRGWSSRTLDLGVTHFVVFSSPRGNVFHIDGVNVDRARFTEVLDDARRYCE